MENQENLETSFFKDTPEIAPAAPPERNALKEVALFIAYFVVGSILTVIFFALIEKMTGLNISGKEENLKILSVAQRNILRLSILISQILTIGLPAYLILRHVHRLDWFKNLGLNARVNQLWLFLSVMMLLASAQFIYFIETFNKSLNLPVWMKSSETANDNLINAIIHKDYWYEGVLAFFMIAVVPPVCEELLFRGWLQPLAQKVFKNDHVAVWLTALIFSAIHFQFEGFAARAALGAIMGYVFLWTKSLWYPMAIHFFNNGAQLIALYALNLKPEDADKLDAQDSVHWTIAVLSLVGVLFLGNVLKDLTNGVKFFKFED